MAAKKKYYLMHKWKLSALVVVCAVLVVFFTCLTTVQKFGKPISAVSRGDYQSSIPNQIEEPAYRYDLQKGHFLRVQYQGPVSNRCFTPAGMCYLPQYGPVGYQCWCATPYGPVTGSIH